ncbi:MAG: hypothetical protein AABY07_00940 [Nanoarchaeota archaeon]
MPEENGYQKFNTNDDSNIIFNNIKNFMDRQEKINRAVCAAIFSLYREDDSGQVYKLRELNEK